MAVPIIIVFLQTGKAILNFDVRVPFLNGTNFFHSRTLTILNLSGMIRGHARLCDPCLSTGINHIGNQCSETEGGVLINKALCVGDENSHASIETCFFMG